jgi:hypothetical protein
MRALNFACVAAPTTQAPPFGGDDAEPPTAPFGLRAPWLHFADMLEVRRLAKLHMRIERRKHGLNVLVKEQQRIMNRCIRRMRRHQGKN